MMKIINAYKNLTSEMSDLGNFLAWEDIAIVSYSGVGVC